MKSAPEKRQIVDCAMAVTVRAPALSNAALEQVISTYEHQSRLLDIAFSSVRGLGDLQVAVRSELLETIDEVCSARAPARASLHSVNRC